jgi:hypothetical protein
MRFLFCCIQIEVLVVAFLLASYLCLQLANSEHQRKAVLCIHVVGDQTIITLCGFRVRLRTSSFLDPNDYANPVAASELPFQKPVVGNSGSAFCYAIAHRQVATLAATDVHHRIHCRTW